MYTFRDLNSGFEWLISIIMKPVVFVLAIKRTEDGKRRRYSKSFTVEVMLERKSRPKIKKVWREGEKQRGK